MLLFIYTHTKVKHGLARDKTVNYIFATLRVSRAVLLVKQCNWSDTESIDSAGGFFVCFLFLIPLHSMWDLISDRGLNLHPQHWKCSILTAGPPGKSLLPVFVFICEVQRRGC